MPVNYILFVFIYIKFIYIIQGGGILKVNTMVSWYFKGQINLTVRLTKPNHSLS